jgi:hypothetical protein
MDAGCCDTATIAAGTTSFTRARSRFVFTAPPVTVVFPIVSPIIFVIVFVIGVTGIAGLVVVIASTIIATATTIAIDIIIIAARVIVIVISRSSGINGK